MRGPIDYMIVEFDGNKFDGSILRELEQSMENGTIAVLSMALIIKDKNGDITSVDISESEDPRVRKLAYSETQDATLIDVDDILEVGDLLENNSSAGLLIVEQLWAKGLKSAILRAHGHLIAEGRIHPEAYASLTQEQEV